MEYELINPSDPYTFVAEDYETAALTVFCISQMYGAKSKDGQETVPVFLFGGGEEWYVEQFGRAPVEGIEAKREQIAQALDSVMLGGFEDRRKYEAALAAITDSDKREEFIASWQSECSSMNDIGAQCHRMAKKVLADL